MRKVMGFRAALILGGAIGLLGVASQLYGAPVVVNGDFESPTNTAGGSDTNVDAWTLSPAPNTNGGTLNYTNNGQRCTFASPTPSGGTWSFWEQTFCQYGTATQTISSGVIPGNTYTMTAQMAFEVGSAPGTGFNGVTLANQAAGTLNTGDLYSYLGMIWLNNHGNPIGTSGPDNVSAETTIPAGSVTTANHVYAPYSVSAMAPVGAVGVELVLGWQNGGTDGNTGGQSAFATDVTLVPEPASLGMLAIGGLALLSRRRKLA